LIIHKPKGVKSCTKLKNVKTKPTSIGRWQVSLGKTGILLMQIAIPEMLFFGINVQKMEDTHARYIN